MKTFVFVVLPLCLFLQWPATYEASAQSGWVIRMNGLPTDGLYYSAAIVDSQTIWIAGAFSVYQTTDLGLTWYEANQPEDTLGFPHTWGTIAAWDTLNAVVATAGDPEGRIFRTSDGGMTWHKVFEDQSVTWYFNDLEMVTDSVGYAVGDAPDSSSPPAIVKTTDAGWSWIPTVHDLPLGCHQWHGPTTDVISPQVGLSYRRFPERGMELVRTTDGGVTREQTSVPRGRSPACSLLPHVSFYSNGDSLPHVSFYS